MQGACVVKRFNSLTSNYKHSAPIDTSPLPDIHLIPLDTSHGQCFTDQFAVVLCPKIYNLSWKGRHTSFYNQHNSNIPKLNQSDTSTTGS
jgi:hypothetical protein